MWTLQQKTLLIIGLTMACLLAILYGVAKVILVRNFDDMEEKDAWNHMERTGAALSELLEDVVPILDLWASSGPLREFVVSRNEDYVAPYVTRDVFVHAGLNFVVLVDRNGKIIFEKGFDLQSETACPVPEDLKSHLSPGSILLSHQDARSTVNGLILLSEGPLMIAAKPILTPRGNPSIEGTMLLGRYLDETKVAVLERMLQRNLTFVRLDRANLPADFEEARRELARAPDVFVKPIDAMTLAAYGRIDDLYRKPALLVRVDIPRTSHRQEELASRMLVWSLLSTGLGVTLVIMRLLHTEVVSRVARLVRRVRSIAASADSSRRVPVTGRDELAGLAQSINVMLDALQSSEKALQNSLEVLRETQAHLIQSEKMAALGALVAGVAHEINTPVGIGVTAASHLERRARQCADLYATNQLRRSDFDEFVKTASESSEMILTNLRRAADLITSFKQVAIDQTSEKRRTFQLKEYIDEVLMSLRPKLKNTGHTVAVNCPEQLELNSFPGAFSQIVTNLVMNSLIHGFEGIEQGQIVIDVAQDKESVLICYSDNGKGVKEEHLSRIFEPFFTTRRGGASSGLGLHIVYNIVTQTLRGQIHCTSIPGEKTTFTIRIPLQQDGDDD